MIKMTHIKYVYMSSNKSLRIYKTSNSKSETKLAKDILV